MGKKKTQEGTSSEPTGVVISDGKKHRKLSKLWKRVLIFGLPLLVLVTGVGTYLYLTRDTYPIVVSSAKLLSLPPEKGATKDDTTSYYLGVADAMVDEGNTQGALSNFAKAEQAGGEFSFGQYLILAKLYKDTDQDQKAKSALSNANKAASKVDPSDNYRKDALQRVDDTKKELGL